MAKYSNNDFIAVKSDELKKKGIWNPRIVRLISNCKSIGHVKNTFDLLSRKYDELIELEILADKANVSFIVDFRQAANDIDKTDIKELRKKISTYKQFMTYKEKCIDKLTKASLPAHFIIHLQNAKTQEELEKILEPLPYKFLREKGLIRPAFYEGTMTEKSVKVVYTNMKNQ